MAEAQPLTPGFLMGGGEMGDRIRKFNWASTPLGPPENWEQSLKTCVRIMLSSSQPIWIGWGKELIKLYNDPYKAIVGGKHPEALGSPASEVWKDIWDDIEPMLKQVMENDEGTYVESQLLIMDRNDYPEETYYTFSYTPIPGDDGGTAGMICANTDDTAQIINARALEVLRGLGKLSYKKDDPQSIYQQAAKVLSLNNKDFPVAVFYEINETEKTARQVAWTGSKEEYIDTPDNFDYTIPTSDTANIVRAISTNEIVISDNNGRRVNLPKGFWGILPKQFVHVPIRISNSQLPCAVLSLGLNPYRKFDDSYQQFVRSIADQLTLEINNIHALQQERKRAEALTEVDKAKTLFFNNISHEFRTPLTLMLGPLEDLLALPESEFDHEKLANIQTTHRNALRLLKLVNTLLDFSRLESGRHEARFTLTDIADYTKNLASGFRSIIEKAGLDFTVSTDKVDDEVYVDRQMWEKIVFNLLSNAFKYTLVGHINVNLSQENDRIVLKVSDTGTGIPEHELPRMFERFHRVHGASGRSFEGTGIGLSMIRELIRLHGGTIKVESREGSGSTFTVYIPTGKTHINPALISQYDNLDEMISSPYTEEAATFLEPKSSYRNIPPSEIKENTILIADDNADMRDYIMSLLHKKFNVITAVNGRDALEKIKQERPSLILSDVMMPEMDGIELLKIVKEQPETSDIPIILLSARAGEESRIAGYDTGADDYLVKPFSAKELIARINAQLKVAATRKHTEQQLRNLFIHSPVAICIFRGPRYVVEVANEEMLSFWGKSSAEVMNKPVLEALPEIEGQGFDLLLENVYNTGARYVAPEAEVVLKRNGQMETVFVKFIYEALRDENGAVSGIMALAHEITDQVIARKKIEESQEQLSIALEGGELGTFDFFPETGKLLWSERTKDFFGLPPGMEVNNETFLLGLHPEDRNRTNEKTAALFAPGSDGMYENEYRTIGIKDGKIRWIRAKGKVTFNEEGKPVRLTGVTQDISRRKEYEEALKESERRFRSLADNSPMIVFMIESGIDAQVSYFNQNWLDYTGQDIETALGRSWDGIVHPEDVELVLEVYRTAFEKNTSYVLEAIRLRRHDGTYRWHMFKANPRFSETGELLGYIGVGLDIHDRKLAEESLKESEERFRTLAQRLPQLIWVTDAEGNREFTSSRWEEFTGTQPDGADSWAATVHPDDLVKVNKRWAESVNTGKIYKTDVRLRSKSGEYRWHSVLGEPVYDNNNRLIKWVGAFIDIHHEKTFSQSLEALVEDRTNELVSKNEVLEKMNDELESFAYISSHDLQEPLRKIQTFASRIMEGEFDNLSEKGKDYFKRIENAALRMKTLIEDLLAYSRTGTEDRKFELINLQHIVDEIQEELSEEIISKNAIIETIDMHDVYIIPFQFRQLIHNLVTNSLKFTRPTTIPRIVIKSEVMPGEMFGSDKLESGKNYCHISISDNGIGFDPEYSEKIFEVFQRLHGREKYIGTGIGLAIVKKIVENHSGIITASGEAGKGATFNIYIPSAENP
ncbi:MAG TPA: PAS domain S-box protein [Flavobacterium sp.]